MGFLEGGGGADFADFAAALFCFVAALWASERALKQVVQNNLSCRQFPWPGTLHAWQRDVVCASGEGNHPWSMEEEGVEQT